MAFDREGSTGSDRRARDRVAGRHHESYSRLGPMGEALGNILQEGESMNARNLDLDIHSASSSDLDRIYDLFDAEERRGVNGNFLCNIDSIADWTAEGRTLMAVARGTGKLLGFLAGDLVSEAIVQVDSLHRGMGIGSALVVQRRSEHLMRRQTLLRVRCAPAYSFPFWPKLGFTVRKEQNVHWAEAALPLRLELPDGGGKVAVAVDFFAEDPRGREEQPFSTFSPAARVDAKGVIRLAERVQVLAPCDPGKCPFIRLTVDGETLYVDKCRYPEIQALGLKRFAHGWHLDAISPIGRSA